MGRPAGKPYQVVRWMQVLDRDRLKRQRNRKDLTQRQLAFLVGTSHTTISLLETGGMKTLTESLALSIAKRLDLPWEDLFIAREAPRVPGVTNVRSNVVRAAAS